MDSIIATVKTITKQQQHKHTLTKEVTCAAGWLTGELEMALWHLAFYKLLFCIQTKVRKGDDPCEREGSGTFTDFKVSIQSMTNTLNISDHRLLWRLNI